MVPKKKNTNFPAIALILPLLFIVLGVSSAAAIDSTKYITTDEIEPGMESYCLTVMKDGNIEKFELEVINVIKSFQPGRDTILVMGKDERFIHSGPIQGCSGSPVYIEGRMAGALSAGWSFSKDPLYMVTPIEYMLTVGESATGRNGRGSSVGIGFSTDMSKPIDLNEVSASLERAWDGFKTGTPALTVTSLPSRVCESLRSTFEKIGLNAVASMSPTSSNAASDNSGGYKLEPGATLAVPLVTGDISIAAVGTVTEVVDGKVYGFGHPFLGFGKTDLPMATGKVHTVVSSISISHKLASATEIVGAIRSDESPGIYGEIGQEAKMIPMSIGVDRFDDLQERSYDCELAVNRFYTPIMVQATLIGAGTMQSELPPEHAVKYKMEIQTKNSGSIEFDNISSGRGFFEVINEASGIVNLLMNNPYEPVEITDINVDIEVSPENIVTSISNIKLSDSKVKPGQRVEVEVTVRSYMAPDETYFFELNVPGDLEDGEYTLLVTGGYGYEKFLRKNAPYKFVPEDVDTLMGVLRNIVDVRRDRLYLVMSLPSAGITVRQKELPYLPATKALLLSDATRTLATKPYKHWIEKEIEVESIAMNSKSITITVEK
jgi:hypothetical protein